MRPNLGNASRGARVRASPITIPTTCGVCRHAASTRMLLSHSSAAHRPTTLRRTIEINSDQKRPITQQHLRRKAEAEEQWSKWAKEIKAGKRKSFLEHLEERCLVHDYVGGRDLVNQLLTERRVGLYAGVDPTAPSIHLGHMLPFMILAWGYVWGLPVTFLLGGSTSRIGDPSGRTQGREMQPTSVRKANIASMHMILKKLGASIEAYGVRHGYRREWAWRRALVNNNVWWNKVPFLEVLRDLGAYMRLGPMLGRDTVKTRLTNGSGMSFAEFSYPLMQAWDWWVLFQKGCQIQVGGNDQFGNLLFGMEAVKEVSRNTSNEQVRNPLKNSVDLPAGLTTPLLTNSAGEKLGKSAGNAVWLDKDMTSPFELYQYMVRLPDDSVERYLKMFTFLPLPKIANIMEKQNADPASRVAQHTLAFEFVELIHGLKEAEAVSWQHRQLFRPRSSTDEPTPLQQKSNRGPHPMSPYSEFVTPQSGNRYAPQTNFTNMPSITVTLPHSLIYGQTLNKIIWSAGMVATKAEGQRVINNRGVYVGSKPGDDGPMGEDALSFTPIKASQPYKIENYVQDNKLMLKMGKWKFKMVNVVSDEEFEKMGLNAPGWDEFKAARQQKQRMIEAGSQGASR